jgi:hypothetical protein
MDNFHFFTPYSLFLLVVLRTFVHKLKNCSVFQGLSHVSEICRPDANNYVTLHIPLTRLLEKTSALVKLKTYLASASATICVFSARRVISTLSQTSRTEALVASL